MTKYITRPDHTDEQLRLARTGKPLDHWDQIELQKKLDAATGYITWLQLALEEADNEVLNLKYQAGMLGIKPLKPRASKRRKETK